MGWKLHDDGLILDGGIHYDANRVRELVTELRAAPNHPDEICDRLIEILDTGIVRSDVVFRLSKWLHWNSWSQFVARKIAKELFHGHIPRRFLDQKNEPMPSWDEAVKDYNEWRKAVVEKAAVTNPYPTEKTGKVRNSSSTWQHIRRIVSNKTNE